MSNPNVPAKGATFEYTEEMILDIEKCRKDILYFAKNYFTILIPGKGKQTIDLYGAQMRILEKMRSNRFFVLLASRQVGKALALNTPVKTPNGWTTMGDLKVGDQVYGLNGKPCKVTQAYETRYNRPCYEIKFDNGEIIIADEEHNWFTERYDQYYKGSVKTTLDIYNTLYQKNRQFNHRIPLSSLTKNVGSYIHITDIKKIETVPVRCIEVDSEDHLFLVGKTCIPTHNSTLMTIYLLWLANFFNDQRILLVANKEATAIEIFGRIRMAYELLPNWLKSPVNDGYGKTSMDLENGSRISISTTTGTAARGQSVSCLVIDECAFIECVHGNTEVKIRNKQTKVEEDISIFDLIEIINKNENISNHIDLLNIENDILEFFENSEYEILTPDGWKDFKGIVKYNKKELLRITTTSGKQIIVSKGHAFTNNDEKIIAQNSLHKLVDTVDGKEKIINIEELEKDFVFDIVEVDNIHKFYGNNIVNHNTHLMDPFWASVFPIVSATEDSKVFMCSTPNGTGNLFHAIYNGAVEGKNGWVHDKILWNEVPGRDDEWATKVKSGLASEEKWRQEFESVSSDTTVDIENIGNMNIGELYDLLDTNS